MRRCKDECKCSAAAILFLLYLLVHCQLLSYASNIAPNSFGIECALLYTSDKPEILLRAATSTAEKALLTCEPIELTPSSAWSPTDGNNGVLNVYMSTLSDSLLQKVMDDSPSANSVLVASTSEGVLDLRTDYNHVYFTNADPATEMLALLSYVFRRGPPKLMGFIYSSQAEGGTSAGDTVYVELLKRMRQLRYAHTLFIFDIGIPYDEKDLTAFINNFVIDASAVLVFLPPGELTTSIYKRLLSTSWKTEILMPSWLIATATEGYLGTQSPLVFASSVIVSSSNPHPEDANFPESMSQFKKDCEGITSALKLNSADGVAAVGAWIMARATLATLQPYTLWAEAPTQMDYLEGVFRPHLYPIAGEIVLGLYHPSCNVGGRMVMLYSLVRMIDSSTDVYYGLESIKDANLILKPWECHAADVVLNITPMVLAGYVRYRALGENRNYMTSQMENTIPRAMVSATFTEIPIDYLESVAVSAWQYLLRQTPAIAVFGPAAYGVDVSPMSQVLVEPVFFLPTPYQNSSNVVYLTATNEQQLGAVAAWVTQSTTDKAVFVVLRHLGESVNAIQSAVEQIMEHADVTVTSTKTLTETDKLSSSILPTSGLVVLMGLVQEDFSTLRAHMQSNTDVRVVLLLDEVTHWYPQIQALNGAPSVSDRLYFATNLPPWVKKTGINSRFSLSFLGVTLGELYRSPASMRGYLAVRVLTILSNIVESPSALALIDALYRTPVLVVDDLPLGPFRCSEWAYDATKQTVVCAYVSNGGAVAINIWSLQDMMSAEGGPTAGPYAVDLLGHVANIDEHSSTSVDPSPPSTTDPSPSPPPPPPPIATEVPGNNSIWNKFKVLTLAAVAVTVLVLSVIAIAVTLCILWSRDSRDNKNAPKDESEAVAIIFTDIESSTALWSTEPEAMSSAVGLHHKLIRQLIVKYKGYEVKTIGDSFMIALKDPFAAVQLARDIQVDLHHANWGSNAIDEAYARIGKFKGGTASDRMQTDGWRGLRVRIGVHFGPTAIVFDKVTKGYDYYGDTVNTAARTESFGSGGQVVCTSAVVEALKENEQESVVLICLGPQQLRGVAAPIILYELHTVVGRVFPSREGNTSANPLPNIDGDPMTNDFISWVENRSMAEDNLSTQMPSVDITPTWDVLEVYFSAYPMKQKIKLLQRTCKRFHMTYPSRKLHKSDEDYLQVLMFAVATRTSTVLTFRQSQTNRISVSSMLQKESNGIDLALKSRQSSEMIIGVDPPVVERKLHPNAMSEEHTQKAQRLQKSESTNVLVLDDGELKSLRSSGKSSSMSELCGQAPRETPMYLNGSPGVSGDEVAACFEESNGMLFRVVDRTTNRCAFYNDTTAFCMHINFSINITGTVEWGPHVVISATPGEGRKRYEGELVVPPLGTEILSVGVINGYKLRYSATRRGKGN